MLINILITIWSIGAMFAASRIIFYRELPREGYVKFFICKVVFNTPLDAALYVLLWPLITIEELIRKIIK